MGRSVNVYIFIAIEKSSKLFKNWQNSLKSLKDIPCNKYKNKQNYLFILAAHDGVVEYCQFTNQR